MAKRISRRFQYEVELIEQGVTRIAGVDEAGRGPLAGPVFAAAVIFPVEWIMGAFPRALRAVNDSKQLPPETRETLFAELVSRPEVCYAITQVDGQMIDQINILRATHRAMNMALAQLRPEPQHVLVDGLTVKSMSFPQTAIVAGDGLSYSIGAASILAKVSRDRLMVQLDRVYPGYGFAQHKGYGTPEHVAAINSLGACPIHRQSFSPFRPAQAEMFAEE
ncbi:MAG TPA: ribonuclease HII [Candidatus Baltobacteraceae bacterium]|nr:ribonuclease HII [Candidatus Baltobacteraceae bacterium]